MNEINGSFAAILAEDHHDNPPGYEFAMQQMFREVPLRGKDVLDVGSGRGLTSLWVSLQGAQSVCSMEPEMEGSRSGVIEIQRRRCQELGLSNIEVVTADFHDFSADDERRFDVIVSNASVNHLDESEHHAEYHRETFDAFVNVAGKFHRLLKPGGVAVVTDASRYGFFAIAKALGVPRRFCFNRQTINYKIHQNPRTWKKVFAAAGFERIDIGYPVPYRLRHLAPLVDSAAGSFFLESRFILRAWRSGGRVEN